MMATRMVFSGERGERSGEGLAWSVERGGISVELGERRMEEIAWDRELGASRIGI